jgi:hypothetical protein
VALFARDSRDDSDRSIQQKCLSAGDRNLTPDPCSVGPDRNVWYTQGAVVGRVMRDGDQSPNRLANRVWFADSQDNKIAVPPFK